MTFFTLRNFRISNHLSGFTLIEMMIVIAIISVLATIGFSLYSNAQKSARDGKRITDIQEIAKAIDQFYFVNSNSFPATADVFSNTLGINTTSYFTSGAAPKDPSTSANYNYFRCTTSTNKYLLCATLENQKNGTTSTAPADCGAAFGAADASGNKQYYCVEGRQ